MRYFDGDALEFLGDLRRRNDRTWFNENKERYVSPEPWLKAAEPKRTVDREALTDLVAVGVRMWGTPWQDDEASAFWREPWDLEGIEPEPNAGAKLNRTTWDEVWPGRRVTEIDSINARLDELAKPGAPRKSVDPAEVDAFITETKEQMVREKLAEAKQAAWERRKDINAVLDPVPVRVDARMRLVTS